MQQKHKQTLHKILWIHTVLLRAATFHSDRNNRRDSANSLPPAGRWNYSVWAKDVLVCATLNWMRKVYIYQFCLLHITRRLHPFIRSTCCCSFGCGFRKNDSMRTNWMGLQSTTTCYLRDWWRISRINGGPLCEFCQIEVPADTNTRQHCSG